MAHPAGPSGNIVSENRRNRFRRAPKGKHLLVTIAGALAGVLAFELALRPLVAGWHYPATPIREIRGYTESIATSHYQPNGFGTYGKRLTGNPTLANAPTILIIGDSHVVQDAVPDHQTMGARVESLSRAGSYPVNVTQIGWYSTAAPTYIATAKELLGAFHPAVTVVLLNPSDFGPEATASGDFWRMKIAPDYSYKLIDVRNPVATGRLDELREFLGRSSLLLSLRRRTILIRENRAVPLSPAVHKTVATAEDHTPVARASVKGLKAEYGERLLIVYTPFCKETCPTEPDSDERALLAACSAERAHCLSMRPEFAADIIINHRISRGFHNSAPGEGHLNQAGLELTGNAIWREISGWLRPQ